MEWLVWIGTVISAVGLIGIIYTVVAVTGAKRANLTDDDLRDRMSRILPINIGALLLSMLGLMMVIVGVILS